MLSIPFALNITDLDIFRKRFGWEKREKQSKEGKRLERQHISQKSSSVKQHWNFLLHALVKNIKLPQHSSVERLTSRRQRLYKYTQRSVDFQSWITIGRSKSFNYKGIKRNILWKEILTKNRKKKQKT